ncbi:putative adhesin/hemolysin precursor [Yersinia frederiksenii]|nr:putative adhesin/hemolysin precursor [Yersinia frederiksenii]
MRACQQVTQDMVDTSLKQQKEILQAAKDITLSASAIQTDGALTLAAGGYYSMLWVRT